jgi:hypothetical protein
MPGRKQSHTRKMPGYKTIVHPDRTIEVLAKALKETEQIVQEWEGSLSIEPLSLFLEGHYPFFDRQVQDILSERHPDRFAAWERDCPYAVDAYIWAEQYAWIAYDDTPFRTVSIAEEFAGFYFVHDLHWFSRLLTAIAVAVERILAARGGQASHEERLQIWRNILSQEPPSDPPPSKWLEGNRFIDNHSKEHRVKQSNSLRASASRINRHRRATFRRWAPLWKAEIESLKIQLRGSRVRMS